MRDFQNAYPNDFYIEFDRQLACWANNHNGWSKAKKKWRRRRKKKKKREFVMNVKEKKFRNAREKNVENIKNVERRDIKK